MTYYAFELIACLSEETIDKLAEDECFEVRRCVAMHKKLLL